MGKLKIEVSVTTKTGSKMKITVREADVELIPMLLGAILGGLKDAG